MGVFFPEASQNSTLSPKSPQMGAEPPKGCPEVAKCHQKRPQIDDFGAQVTDLKTLNLNNILAKKNLERSALYFECFLTWFWWQSTGATAYQHYFIVAQIETSVSLTCQHASQCKKGQCQSGKNLPSNTCVQTSPVVVPGRSGSVTSERKKGIKESTA